MVNYIIMAHVKRAKYVPKLIDTLGCPVSWDKGDLGLVNAHIQAWEMMPTDKPYGCVIQDDVILTSDFMRKAEYHVQQGLDLYGPDIAYHFYMRNKPTLRHLVNHPENHVLLDGLYSGNSICLPTHHIAPMIEHFKECKDVKGGDRRIHSYLRSQQMKVYFPLPSLVDHRNLPSLHNNNTSPIKNRVALWFEP
jgi:hypothetical protein